MNSSDCESYDMQLKPKDEIQIYIEELNKDLDNKSQIFREL